MLGTPEEANAIVSNQQLQKVKVKRLAHVGLWATDVLAQTRFYRQVLGFDLHTASDHSPEEILEREDAAIFLTLGGGYHSLGLFNDNRPLPTNGRKSTQRTQLHHLSFEVDTDAELAALAARLKMAGINLELGVRDGSPELGDTLWFNDPDGNYIEISVTPDDLLTSSSTAHGRRALLQPRSLQHVALRTMNLESIVEFYTEALGFDISDWLLRECAWLRCDSSHHSIMFLLGKPGIDHIGYHVTDRAEFLLWCDHLADQQVPLVWGPGRHGAGNDLFLRCTDAEGMHIELSTEVQHYHDRDVTTPPRLWHTRAMAFNLWGPQLS